MMHKAKHTVYHHHRKVIRRRSLFILSRWMAAFTVFLIVVLSILTGGSVFNIAGIFIKPTPTPTPNPNKGLMIKANLTQAEYVNLALSALSQKENISSTIINLISIVEMDWANASLGCPEPRKMYAQMITPGYLIKLAVGEKEFSYHAGLNRVVSCSG